MKLLNDKQEEIPVNSDIFLGEVEVGTTKDFTFYLYNESKGMSLDIKVEAIECNQLEDVKILEVPQTIDANTKKAFIVRWIPTLKVEAGLHMTLKVTGKTIWK